MSSWTQIVVKGSVAECSAALTARCVPPSVARVVSPEFCQWKGRAHILVPSTPEVTARLHAWWQSQPQESLRWPIGSLLWFGPFIGRVDKSLLRVSDYATVGEPLSHYLSEI